MDKVCKKVLKQMHGDGPPERFAYWLFWDSLKLEADSCGLSVEEFANSLERLIAEGWAEYVFTRSGNKSGVKLTHKGVHYKEYIASERTKTLLLGFVLPLLVSIVGTVITTALLPG